MACSGVPPASETLLDNCRKGIVDPMTKENYTVIQYDQDRILQYPFSHFTSAFLGGMSLEEDECICCGSRKHEILYMSRWGAVEAACGMHLAHSGRAVDNRR